jgi:iron(III) transport system permease protein
VIERLNEIQFSNFITLFFNSFILSTISSFIALIVALYLVISSSSSNNVLTKAAISISRLGYAFPGIILALGVIIVLSLIDKIIDHTSLLLFGSLSSIMISGGLIGVFYAYISRFLTVSYGTIDAGFSTLNSNLADASRILGMGKYETLKKVQIPIIKPAIIMAILLVFIDTMKELPATLILRPFNFDTLATNVYTYASLSDIQNAALPSLTIVIAGLLPVILINRELTKS